MFGLFRSHHPVRHTKSLYHSLVGVKYVFMNEANFRIQVLVAAFSVFLGVEFGISRVEWAILALSAGLLLSAEVLNTAIEELIDHLVRRRSEVARVIKDLSAGFVLLTALTNLVVLVAIFGERVVKAIG